MTPRLRLEDRRGAAGPRPVAVGAIGDDRLLRQAQGYAVPDSFTHGSSAQRTEWFARGYERGTLSACDTF